jgi:hypothetical protein
MSDTDQRIAAAIRESQELRRNLNQTIKLLQGGSLRPSEYCLRSIPKDKEVGEILGPIMARCEAAREAAIKKRELEILATPIDDEAWQAELHRRADFERRQPGWIRKEL